MTAWWLFALVGLPWGGSIIVALFTKRWGRASGFVAFSLTLASAVIALVLGSDLTRGAELALNWRWIPSMGIDFALRLDSLSFPFLVNVLGVSLISICYGWGYLRVDGRLHLCYALLLGFMGSMLGTLLADDLFLFFVFWESMLVTSSLLLAGWGEGERVGAVTLKYFVYTQFGSLLVLVALLMLVAETGSSDLVTIQARVSALSQAQLTWISALFVVGFSVKLAVFPLHSWLPDAHSIAPMPVTVMLAAAMLSMGAYGILRFPVGILGAAGMRSFQLPLMILAFISEIYGALMCLAVSDIKRIVAYSSVSQMGYVLFAVASLTSRGVAGGIFEVIDHGILKALLFMGVGLVMLGTGRRRIEKLGGLAQHMPKVATGMGIGAIALAGLPPFCAFHAEWMIFSGGLSSPYPALGYLELLVPILTAAYALWLVGRLAFNPAPPDLQVRPRPVAMRWSFYVLVALALGVGLYPAPIYQWVGRAATLLALGN